jgi:hypothetical protein
MPQSAAELLEAARHLPSEERELLLHALQEDEFTEWQKQVGEPEHGYDEWFRVSVEEALADTSPGVPHEQAMKHFHDAIRKARRLKNTA